MKKTDMPTSLLKSGGSSSVMFAKPEMVNLVLKNALAYPETELRVISDGSRTWLYAPALKQYELMHAGPQARPFAAICLLGKEIGPFHVLPLFRMFLSGLAVESFGRDAQRVSYVGTEQVDGAPATVISWDHDSQLFFGGLRLLPIPLRNGPGFP